MRAGKFVKVGTFGDMLHHPSDPYARELLAGLPGLPARQA